MAEGRFYKPLSDNDGAIDDTFQYLLSYSNAIEGKVDTTSFIAHYTAEVIKFRDGVGMKSINDYCLTPLHLLTKPKNTVRIPKGGWPGEKGCPGQIDWCKRDLFELMDSTTATKHRPLLAERYTKAKNFFDNKNGTLRERIQIFDIFSDEKFEHHPFHYHKFILLGVEAQLKFHLMEAFRLFDILYKISDENMDDQMEQRIFTAEYVIDELTPQLQHIAKTIRKLIIVSQDGYYSKIHASNIAMLYPKNTKERLHVITQLVQNKCVPSKKALYEVINTRENGLVFTEEEWSRRGGKRKHGCVQDCLFENSNKCFIGRFELALIRVEWYKAGRMMEFYCPPKMVYICDYIGKTCDKFYFSPIQFPTPSDLSCAGRGEVFESLKSYIEYASKKGGSPVVCRSYKPGCKKFVCKTHSKSCKFSFLVKWDMFGYYITLNSDTSGCGIHNHSRVLACPYEKYGCMYCKATFNRLADAVDHEKYCKEQKESERHFSHLDIDTLRKRMKVARARQGEILCIEFPSARQDEILLEFPK